MRILITGGAGYLGSVLTTELMKHGHSVLVIDNFVHGVPSLSGAIHNPGMSLLVQDVREGIEDRDLAWADVIIPLAAVVGAPACDRNEKAAYNINYTAIRNIIPRISRDQLLIYPNTNSGYGIGGEEFCTEDSPLLPISVYGKTKVEAEKAVLDHPTSVVFRFATLFGPSPRMRLDLMVNQFTFMASRGVPLMLYEGHFRRNFLHVHDAAQAIIHAVHNPRRMVGNIFNAGDDRANMTKRGLCSVIQSVAPPWTVLDGEGTDLDQRDYIVSNAKIASVGWTPKKEFIYGIREILTCCMQPIARGAYNSKLVY